MSNGSMHTLCLRSTDATEVSEGAFRWTLRSQHIKPVAAKALSLSSIELPLSQWSLEDAWSRVHVSERILLTPTHRRLDVRQEVLAPTQDRVAMSVILPVHLNRIARLWSDAEGLVHLQTEAPHGLSDAMLRWIATYEEHCKVVAAAVDTIDVSVAWGEGRVRFEAADLLVITPKTPQPTFDTTGGYLLFPSPPSPQALAEMLTAGFRGTRTSSQTAASPSVRFDSKDCAFFLSVAAYPSPDATEMRLTIGGDGLAALMSFGGQSSRTFHRRPLDPRTAGYSGPTGREFLQQHIMSSDVPQGDTTPLELRGDAAGLFGFAKLRPGWYTPSQRIYSTSAPLRLSEEWELQFARFFFPASDGEPPPGLVFTSPDGVNRLAELLPGLYTARSLAAYLEALMNEDVQPGIVFTVTFEEDGPGGGGRFRFSCTDGHGMGLAFALHFSHPRSINPAKLGFEAAYLEGSDSYESTDAIHEPRTPFGRLNNLYQITEVHGQRKFCIRPTAPPTVIAIAEAYDPATRILSVRCVTSGKAPVSHGLQRGSTVLIASSGFVKDAATGERTESVPRGATALGVVSRGTEANAVALMELEVPPLEWILQAAAEQRCMGLTQNTEPASFCFAGRLPGTVLGERLGFDNSTLHWGIHGAVRTRKLRIPPYVSTGSHNLDHVDFVFLRIREGNKSTLMQCETAGGVTSVWTKVALNPVYRNERHIGVDVSFPGGERLDTLTVEVLNPDLTPYHFHGAAWSLTVTFAT